MLDSGAYRKTVALLFSICILLMILPQSSNSTASAVQQNILSWAYQLQNAFPSQIANSGFNLVVIDYSRDGSDSEAYTPSQIDMIKKSGIIPVAYISIGEAEDYRFYWNDSWYSNPPPWLGKENRNWSGDFAVKYWYPEWKAIIFQYLDKIIRQGFSGVYLDKVDEYEYWSNPDNGENFTMNITECAREMIKFVVEIAKYCRNKTNGDFLIIPQNAESILKYDNGTYLQTISGIGIESLWYNGTHKNSENYIESRMKWINIIKNSGKLVLSVDYVDDGTGYQGENKLRIDDYIKKARDAGYIPYAALADFSLKKLNIIPGVQPPENTYSEINTWFFEIFAICTIIIAVSIVTYIRIKKIKT